MALVRVTAPARRDIDAALAQSRGTFGEAASRRYSALVRRALRDLAEDPYRPGSRQRSDLGDGIRSYHLVHCRKRARTPDGIVHAPRHLLIYRMRDPETVAVLRLLHDAMEPHRHLP
ncbi:MAG TPA: type II toxin-antitoxin system RelE/ParE family toxin [Azospirillum sp.]|nr:type II toxin-antitoxin system RelE/ParE family toxin [Azospirillum sp.]